MTNANEVLQLSMEKIISEIEQEMIVLAEAGSMSIPLDSYPDNVRSCKALKDEFEKAGFIVELHSDLISTISWENPASVNLAAYTPESNSSSDESEIEDDIPIIHSSYEAS